MLNQHYTDVLEVDEQLASRYWADLRRSASAIRAVTKADRLNYAVLGNLYPHVHIHIVPRIKNRDPIPTKSPWQHPDPLSNLDPISRRGMIRRIAAAVDPET